MTSETNEFQQAAAIMSMDIDTLAKVSENDHWSAKQLRAFIARLKTQKDLAITDANVREMRYNTLTVVFNIEKN